MLTYAKLSSFSTAACESILLEMTASTMSSSDALSAMDLTRWNAEERDTHNKARAGRAAVVSTHAALPLRVAGGGTAYLP